MIRSIYVFALIALLAVLGVWLAEHPGSVAVRWDNYVVETNLVVLILGALLTALLAGMLFRLYVWLRTGPGRLGGAFAARRRSKGLEALSNGMVAIAAGDAGEARRAAIEAEKHLKDEPMTLLLAAQAAELNGDDRATRIYYNRMIERGDTEFLGLRGLIARARAEQDLETALAHARRADMLKPGTEWVLKEMFDLTLKLRLFDEADAVLNRMARGKAARGAAVRRLKAVVGYERALARQAAGEKAEAEALVQAAHEADPAFVPATAMLLQLLPAGRKRDKLVTDAWRRTPHPSVAAAIRALAPTETESDWFARAGKQLAPIAPEDRETALVMGRAALDAQEWGEARRWLNKALAADPTTAVYRLLAELEERANADAVAARDWIIKSADAPQDPVWICNACGRQELTWTAHCPTCDSFDSMAWRKPDRAAGLLGEIEAEIVEEIPAPVRSSS